MSCVVGVIAGGVVAMGGDSAASGGCQYDLIASPKVERVGELLIGATGSPRVSDVVHNWLSLPAVEGDARHWMVRVFVPTLMATFQMTGVPTTKTEGLDWALLVAAGGRLFAVYDDFQVEETRYGFHAIGCGSRPALGALHALSEIGSSLPAQRAVQVALRSAEASDVHVRAPFIIETVSLTATEPSE